MTEDHIHAAQCATAQARDAWYPVVRDAAIQFAADVSTGDRHAAADEDGRGDSFQELVAFVERWTQLNTASRY